MVEAYKIRANALETSMGLLPATHVGLLYLVPKTIYQPLKKEHERVSESGTSEEAKTFNKGSST